MTTQDSQRDGTSPVPSVRRGFGARLRAYFLTGLIVTGPVAITLYISWWLINLVDDWVKPLIPRSYSPESYLPFSVPGLGLVAAFLAITIIGFLTANLVGRSIVGVGDRLLNRTPFVRGLYRGVKQIFETVFKQEGTSFRRVAMIEWPGEGLWSLCFVTEPPQGPLADALPDREHVCVFVPCTPNPTTGYLVMMHRDRVREIEVSTEDAFKFVMSMGIIQPSAPRGPDQMAVPAVIRNGEVVTG